uniref:hypothetical protein n=1 Tax=Acetatifactor sp. TaxID=1872090 RepID=UPI0040574E31
MNSLKIEIGAILSVKNIIFKHPLMHDYINDNDKEPSWDGFIYLYKSDDLKAENITNRVPVQVKGKNDESILKRKSITYQVEYKHLRNYYHDGGVFYIVVAISDDGEETAIFYNALSTIKLYDLLKGSEGKGPEQKKSIALRRLEKKYGENLFKLLKQIGMDRKNQGAGDGEIIKKAITIGDMDKVDFIQASSYFASNEGDLLKEIAEGEISLYGHRADLDMWVPFDYSHQKEIILKRIIQMDRPIGVDGVNFYDSYLVEGNVTQDDNPIIMVSENLTLDIMEEKFYFDTKGTLQSLLRDLEFINALKDGKQLFVNNQKVIDIKRVKIPKGMQNKLQLIAEVASAFKEIGVNCNKRFDSFTRENWQNINELLGIYHRQITPKKGKDSAWYLLKWDDQVVPLLLHNNEKGKIDIINWFTTKQYSLFINSEMKCELPRFIFLKRDILEKLYDVPENLWIDEIERIRYSEDIITEILLFFVEVLAAYDVTHNEIYFKVADALTDKLLEIRPEDEYLLINKIQLIKRKSELSEDCIIKLEELEKETENPMTKCAINILLENKRMAKKLIAELPEEKRNEMMSYPIYNLL